MNIFIQLPEKFDEEKTILSDFISVCTKAKKEGFILHYSKPNVESFQNDNEECKVYLQSDIAIFRQLLSRAKESAFISKPLYIQWNLDEFKTFPCSESLQNIAHNLYNDTAYSYKFVNFGNSIKTCRDKILVFRDDKKEKEYTDYFLHIDFISDADEFDLWLKTYSKAFNLFDKSRFQKRSELRMKGATVYLEYATEYYWHKDTFHHYIEYEIYDNGGKHIGTADENGKIDFAKKDPDKKNILGK
ncbi:hypothetical protein [Chryseobacterium gambrini]|uniref:hypothetical protein n=1 Tax=Chryseobacterium gambrini TaxID=373672 RepID=UPI003D113CCB